ncbi:MAG: hypothetical protein K1060chlam2_00097 [Chlamydiae bacterium]|nr:hypothetical protein [Chlamydiota bacterium]
MASRRYWKIDSNEGASVLTVRAPEGEVILQRVSLSCFPQQKLRFFPKKFFWRQESTYRVAQAEEILLGEKISSIGVGMNLKRHS